MESSKLERPWPGLPHASRRELLFERAGDPGKAIEARKATASSLLGGWPCSTHSLGALQAMDSLMLTELRA